MKKEFINISRFFLGIFLLILVVSGCAVGKNVENVKDVVDVKDVVNVQDVKDVENVQDVKNVQNVEDVVNVQNDDNNKNVDGLNLSEYKNIDISKPFVYEGKNGEESYGTVTVTGYLEIRKDVCKSEGCYSKEKTPELFTDMAYFVYVESDSKDFLNYMNGSKKIVIGCLEDNKIVSQSVMDNIKSIGDNVPKYEVITQEITGEEYQMIMNSSKEKLIKLQMSQTYSVYRYCFGYCCSDFTNFKIIK